ncbi:MAG: hypothetical protein COB69_04725, partial [Phycisphaera sp.]
MLRNGQILFLCALALLTLGVLMVTSAGMQIDQASAEQPILVDGGLSPIAIMSGRTGMYAALAIGVMGAMAFVPQRLVERAIKPRPGRFYLMLGVGAAALLGLLLLVYLPGIAREKNFSSRWIEIPAPVFGTLSIQPSEIVKWSMLGLLAWCAVSAGDRLRLFWRGLVPMLIVLGLVCAVIMKEDLGTAVLIGAVGVIVLLAAGAKVWHIGVLAPAATPKPVVDRLNAAINKLLALPDVKTKLDRIGVVPMPETPAEFNKRIQE